MLLNNLIVSLQNQYSDIQSQIELLQESQRQIQAQLQAIGSVESKMESALALVAEAISDINHHCPDELGNYQKTVNSLFSGAIAHIPPQNDENDENESAPVEVEVEAEKLPESQIKSTPTEPENNIEEENGESQGEKVYEFPDLDILTASRLRQICRELGLSDKGIKNTLVNRILDSQSN